MLTDAAFTGLEGLAGSLYQWRPLNLHPIQQTSILGDSDQIALAMDLLIARISMPDWSISTGANALSTTRPLSTSIPSEKPMSAATNILRRHSSRPS